MNVRFFNTGVNAEDVEYKWNKEGERYARAVNALIGFVDANGWDNWNGEEPYDNRGHLSGEVIRRLIKANVDNEVDEFRQRFPPAHSPFIKYFESKGQTINQLFHISDDQVVLVIGSTFEKREVYLLKNDTVIKVQNDIVAVGKSKLNEVFAIQLGNFIKTTKGWNGEVINTFEIKKNQNIVSSQLMPFNDGSKVLSITSEGVYLISENEEKLLLPHPDPEDEEYGKYIDMGNGAISNDNQYIVAGSQVEDHKVFNSFGEIIAEIGPQSSYPHFCLFSSDDSQLITNSCHFYNGITIGVKVNILNGVKVPSNEESDLYNIVDDEMRVYCGITIDDYYVLGDAYGYIRAINKHGELLWRHFLGSSIGSIASSNDGKTLWVGSHSGIVHKLRLFQGHRDTHTIGTGNHYEEFRVIFWKNEPILKW